LSFPLSFTSNLLVKFCLSLAWVCVFIIMTSHVTQNVHYSELNIHQRQSDFCAYYLLCTPMEDSNVRWPLFHSTSHPHTKLSPICGVNPTIFDSRWRSAEGSSAFIKTFSSRSLPYNQNLSDPPTMDWCFVYQPR
jgi:hypothetical protein